MKDEIINKLHEIEEKENIEILLAVESGSRAWGFASPDSDYDVRFIYKRPKEYYLKLEKTRDVVELPINGVLDIGGWDIDKTLKLLKKSNPTLFEWKASPIVYLNNDFLDCTTDELFKMYFSEKKSLYHYLSMAKNNYRAYLKTDKVKAKKYFYAIRPLLACEWIIKNHTQPPVLFSQLVSSVLPSELHSDIQRLLEIKMNVNELQLIDRVDKINCYIENSIEKINYYIKNLPYEKSVSWKFLNDFFLSVVK